MEINAYFCKLKISRLSVDQGEDVGSPHASVSPSGELLAVCVRWDDDVVFKNCARGEVDKKERRFINDTLRSDFHRKFMEKYIK